VINIQTYNLLVSCPRYRERDASAELIYIFAEIGDDNIKVRPSGVPSLLFVKTKFEPIEAIHKLKEYFKENLQFIKFTLRYLPIEIMVRSEIDNIIEAINKLKNKIKSDESYKILIEKRHTYLERKDIINKIASILNNKVDLKNPNKIILIEILGERTGISIIEPDDIISVPKLKQV